MSLITNKTATNHWAHGQVSRAADVLLWCTFTKSQMPSCSGCIKSSGYIELGVLNTWLTNNHWGGGLRYLLKFLTPELTCSALSRVDLCWAGIRCLRRDKAVGCYQDAQQHYCLRRRLVQTVRYGKRLVPVPWVCPLCGAPSPALSGIYCPNVWLTQNTQSESTCWRNVKICGHLLLWAQRGCRWAVLHFLPFWSPHHTLQT